MRPTAVTAAGSRAGFRCRAIASAEKRPTVNSSRQCPRRRVLAVPRLVAIARAVPRPRQCRAAAPGQCRVVEVAMPQTGRGNRRGANFTVRVSEEDRRRLATLQSQGGGPSALGPWLVWNAMRIEGAAVGAVPELVDAAVPALLPGLALPREGSAAARAVPVSERLILDLCAGSGSWSAPYAAAGYRVQVVTLPDGDVRVLPPPKEPVWGILAGPPCDQFSIARNGHSGTPRDFVAGMACVNACLRLVLQCRPKWWALENPASGLLARWLGIPRDSWQPHDFGDPWTKHTAIWGDYRVPRRGPYVAPLGGGPLCTVCDPERRKSTWCNDAGHRAITPAGFARAFFEANQ